MDLTHLSSLTGNGLLQNIHNQFYMLLLATSIDYAKRYGISESLYHEHYQVLKYSSGEEYGCHYDGPSSTKRVISAVCYLNDRYEGGEIEFPFFDIKYRPVPGSLILFPSNFAYTHIAHPVKTGVKYNLVTWIADRNI
jgi:predicted 2-oxoglutarate/Fe(II)-dependent dioxygenase YbiX